MDKKIQCQKASHSYATKITTLPWNLCPKPDSDKISSIISIFSIEYASLAKAFYKSLKKANAWPKDIVLSSKCCMKTFIVWCIAYMFWCVPQFWLHAGKTSKVIHYYWILHTAESVVKGRFGVIYIMIYYIIVCFLIIYHKWNGNSCVREKRVVPSHNLLKA